MWGYVGSSAASPSLHIMQTRDTCRMPHLLSGGDWGDKGDFRGALPSHPGHDIWVLLQELGDSYIYQFLCGQSVCFAQQGHFPRSHFPAQNWNFCLYLSVCFGVVIWTWTFSHFGDQACSCSLMCLLTTSAFENKGLWEFQARQRVCQHFGNEIGLVYIHLEKMLL